MANREISTLKAGSIGSHIPNMNSEDKEFMFVTTEDVAVMEGDFQVSVKFDGSDTIEKVLFSDLSLSKPIWENAK